MFCAHLLFQFRWILILALLIKSFYWVSSALTLSAFRFEREVPIQVPVFHALFLILELLPALLSTTHIGYPTM